MQASDAIDPELPRFRELYHKLVQKDLDIQLPGVALVETAALTESEIRQLVGYASILSTSSVSLDRARSYEIATRLVELHGREYPGLITAGDIIFSRIGNFPGRKLLRERYATAAQGSVPYAPSRLWLERATREIENSVTQFDETEIPLTDFQYLLYAEIDQSTSVSVSAPTSAGKSFVMGLDLVRRLRKGGPACIVYLVPTRALIREVTFELRKFLRQGGLRSLPVRSVPFPIEKEQAPLGAVYVLTQERLMSLLHSPYGRPWITTLVVDEAQGIQDGARGIILQSAIEATLLKFPGVDLYFASPLIKNPEYLLSIFGRSRQGKSWVETLSPVSQNLILVSEVHNKTAQASFEILLEGEHINLGVRTLPFLLRGSSFQQRANLAKAVTQADEATLLFANRAADTEKLATKLAQGQTQTAQLDSEINEFIAFLKEEIHIGYPLINTLPYRVAFHYGYMPAIVRARVEDLFKKGSLKYVCCTSTLLQGVNLPARHIIIENPKRGSRNPMVRRDFLNLAGRAGRLLHEFHGNIWCIRPLKWEEKCYEGEPLQEVRAAMSEVMADGGSVIQRLLADKAGRDEVTVAEAAFGKVFNDFIATGKDLMGSEFRTTENETALALTSKECQDIDVTLPADLLDANRAVRPDRLQALYNYFKTQSDPLTLVPIKPGLAHANQRMKKIIKVIQEQLAGVNNDSYVFYSFIASQWIYNTPLKTIIANHIKDRREKGDTEQDSVIIRKLLKTLEEEIRFRLVKHFSAYTGVLALVLRESNKHETANTLEPFHIYLECGASNRTALNLIALGLSRVTALAIYDKVAFPDNATPEECLAQLSRIKIENLKIPQLCVREVRELFGQ